MQDAELYIDGTHVQPFLKKVGNARDGERDESEP